MYAKVPPYLKESINQAHLENGMYEQVVKHLERELELNRLEAPDELQINTVNQQPTNTNADRPKQTCHNCKKPGPYRNQCRLLKNSAEKLKNTKIFLETQTVTPITLTRTTTSIIKSTTRTRTKKVTEPKESRKLFTHPVRHVKKQTSPQGNATLEPMQRTDRLLGTEERRDRTRSHKEPIKKTLKKLLKLQPKI